MNDERVSTRIPIEFRASGVKGVGKLRNASEGGMFVASGAIPEAGDTVELVLSAPGQPEVKVSGLVWWTTRQQAPTAQSAPRGFGLRLLDADDRYLALLNRLR
jgi:Tfp pilus assembly protein PilZ